MKQDFMSSTEGVWVLIEQKQKQVADIHLEALSEARRLADELKEETCVVVAGTDDRELVGTLASYGADKIFF
jgi:electron transfer flavoprotein alpha subunit